VLFIDGKIRVCSDGKQEQRKLRRINAESHAVRRCVPGTRLTHYQSSREIAYLGS
jgi:hypothetical protein